MDGNDIKCAEILRINNSNRIVEDLGNTNSRPIVDRLWQSYVEDLAETLEAHRDGHLDKRATLEYMRRLVERIESLSDGGALAEAVTRAEVVIVDKMLEEVGT